MSSVLRRARRITTWLVLIVAAGMLTLGVLVPRVAGATPYTVLTGSMRPELPPGSLVVVTPVAAEDVSIGDVITYQIESGEPDVVTHRVVSVGLDAQGERTFVTQGDANGAADQDPVRPIQVRGELWYSVPYLGHANELLTGQQRQWAGYGVAALLLGYALLMWADALRDRRRRPDHEPVGGRHATAA